jgi:hypothetical protein
MAGVAKMAQAPCSVSTRTIPLLTSLAGERRVEQRTWKKKGGGALFNLNKGKSSSTWIFLA